MGRLGSNLWRRVAAGFPGGLLGGLVLGLGGRLVMRLIALAAGLPPGFSLGGSVEVFLTGFFIGLPAALVYAAVRQLIPGPGLWRGAAFGALLFVMLVLFPLPAARSAAGSVGQLPLTLSLFGPLFVLYGVVVEFAGRRFAPAKRGPAPEA